MGILCMGEVPGLLRRMLPGRTFQVMPGMRESVRLRSKLCRQHQEGKQQVQQSAHAGCRCYQRP